MLTAKQKTLFSVLGLREEDESEIRKHHKLVKKTGGVKDFTRWLEKCLEHKWREENARARGYTYVGD